MIRCKLGRQPKGFKKNVTIPGLAWLKANPGADRPRPYWSQYIDELGAAFHHRCGYLAMLEDNGTVDHYLSWKKKPKLAYDWKNYRYVTGRINSAKKVADSTVLDPLEVRDGWFEIDLPSLELRRTSKVPAARRKAADNTLRVLRLDRGPSVVAQRKRWLCRFLLGEPLTRLEDYAPLLADAIKRQPGQHLPASLVAELQKIIAKTKK